MEASVYVPAPIREVFDFIDDPANTLRLNQNASEHAAGIEVVATEPDGRSTVDIRMAAGGMTWVQTIEQVIREPPSRLVSRSWTWTAAREARLLSLLSDRRLDVEATGTRLNITVEYELTKPSLVQRARLAMQRGAAQLELEHQLHFLAARFAADGIHRR